MRPGVPRELKKSGQGTSTCPVHVDGFCDDHCLCQATLLGAEVGLLNAGWRAAGMVDPGQRPGVCVQALWLTKPCG